MIYSDVYESYLALELSLFFGPSLSTGKRCIQLLSSFPGVLLTITFPPFPESPSLPLLLSRWQLKILREQGLNVGR